MRIDRVDLAATEGGGGRHQGPQPPPIGSIKFFPDANTQLEELRARNNALATENEVLKLRLAVKDRETREIAQAIEHALSDHLVQAISLLKEVEKSHTESVSVGTSISHLCGLSVAIKKQLNELTGSGGKA